MKATKYLRMDHLSNMGKKLTPFVVHNHHASDPDDDLGIDQPLIKLEFLALSDGVTNVSP